MFTSINGEYKLIRNKNTIKYIEKSIFYISLILLRLCIFLFFTGNILNGIIID